MKLSLTKSYRPVLIIIIVPLTLFPLCLLLLVPRTVCTVNLCTFYSCRIIGKLTVFLNLQEFSMYKQNTSITVAWCSPHNSSEKVGHILNKAVGLCINLNIDDAPVASRSLRHVTGPFPVSPVPVLAGEVVIRSEPTGSPV